MSRETYSALFSLIGTTYGSGNGSTTFALPNLIDKFIEGSSTAGTEKGAGLPNLQGQLVNAVNKSVYYQANGVFANSTYPGTTGIRFAEETATDYKTVSNIVFNANRGNSIYGNSTTVQPPALTMMYAIYAGAASVHRWIRQS